MTKYPNNKNNQITSGSVLLQNTYCNMYDLKLIYLFIAGLAIYKSVQGEYVFRLLHRVLLPLSLLISYWADRQRLHSKHIEN